MAILIRKARLIDAGAGIDAQRDLLIDDSLGRVAEIGEQIQAPEGARVIDAEGKWALPGLIDLHVHFRDPGMEYKEDVCTGSDAAARGGFTSVCCMANTRPVNDSKVTTRYIIEKAEQHGKCRVMPFASLSQRMKGEAITPMQELLEAGAIGFSDDGHNVDNAELMRVALEYSHSLNALIAAHNEDPHIGRGGVVNEGVWSSRTGLRGIPAVTESLGVARDIELARYTGARVHFCHLSTRRSVQLVREAKRQGIPVTAEVTPHHLLLNDACIAEFNTNFKMNPPLRSEDDRLACIEGLVDGTIDCIATDHAPHAIADKEKEFDHAPFGVIGLESAFAVCMQLVDDGLLELQRLVEALTSVPARILGRPDLGTLAPGNPADLCLIDPNCETVIDEDFFRSRSRNSAFLGTQVRALPVMTILGGRITFEDSGA